jgi:hypothetical protein
MIRDRLTLDKQGMTGVRLDDAHEPVRASARRG